MSFLSPQTTPTFPTVQPSPSSAAYTAPNAPIYVLPPNSSRPPSLLLLNLYALPPTNLSYQLYVKNPQIHSIFEVGESSAHSNPNVQASLGLTQEQLEGLQQHIAAIEATLGMTSYTLVPIILRIW